MPRELLLFQGTLVGRMGAKKMNIYSLSCQGSFQAGQVSFYSRRVCMYVCQVNREKVEIIFVNV